MPRLPVIQPRGAPGLLRAPRLTGENFGAGVGRGLTQIGGQLQGIANKMQAAQDRLDLSRHKGEYNARIKEFRFALEQNEDYLQHGDIFREGETKIRKEILDSVDRKDVQSALTASINLESPTNQFEVEKRGLILLGEAQLGNLAVAGDRLLTDAGRADPAERAKRVKDFNELVDTVQRGAPNLNPAGAVAMKLQFKKEMEKRAVADIESLIVEDAPGTLELLQGGAFDDLPLDTVTRLEKNAKSQITSNVAKFNQAEKIRINRVESVLLEKLDDRKLTFPEVERMNIPTLRKIAWRKLLHKQAKDENPFLVSDPTIHAQTFTDISLHPERWTVTKVMDLVGNGLSTKDGMKARKLLDDLGKEDGNPKKFQPLQLAMSSLERIRSSQGIFIKEADRFDPQAIFKNEVEAQRVRDVILEAHANGQDPVEALKIVMKPYLAQSTFDFFDLIRNPFSLGITQPAPIPEDLGKLVTEEQEQENQILELNARRWLQQNKTPPTAKNLRRTMKYLKEK